MKYGQISRTFSVFYVLLLLGYTIEKIGGFIGLYDAQIDQLSTSEPQ